MTAISTRRFGGFGERDAPSYETLNTCVQCGLCLPACPTYREEYREQSSPRGRIHLMKSVHDGRLDVLDPLFLSQMYECLDCRACEAVCPSGVEYGGAVEAARTQIEQARRQRGRCPLKERLLRRIVFGGLFGNLTHFRAACATARLYQRSGAQRVLRATGVLRRLGLADLERQLPAMSREFFVPRGQVYPAIGAQKGRVALLAGCIMETAYAEVDRATIRVLRANGWEIVVPASQGCCGALHVHAGELEQGRALMRRNIEAFESTGADLIVSNAAGCGAALKEYNRLLAGDSAWAARAAAFCEKVRDVTELLAGAPLVGSLGPIEAVVTYQDPCHLQHAQRIADAPRRLVSAIPGLRVVEMAESALCCGSAGIYSVTHAEMSARLLERKLDHALATGATTIVTANPGCMLQLRSGLRRRGSRVQVRHVVDILDAAYRRGEAKNRAQSTRPTTSS